VHRFWNAGDEIALVREERRAERSPRLAA